ncbi:hypothetical protein FRC07_001629 [Ceratobasidium sp. 392]|nr:hypothetical protein FRC07_001629 [Ceratobasidium sp. 392]
MSNDLSVFTAAALPFFRTAPEVDLMRRFDEILEHNPRYSHRAIEYRTDAVTDFRGYPVPAAVERLIRWDRRHPDIIFNEGFRPHETPADESGIARDNADLGVYVDSNSRSVFVSTARTYEDEDTGLPIRWAPHNLANRFEYEIFAAGGIDINLSLGRLNQYWDQHEIAFPGGIRPEFIRTARQYNGTGHLVAIWANPNFDISASGPSHGAELAMLPDPDCMIDSIDDSIDIHYWMGPPEDRPQRMLMRANIPANDPMHEKGAPQVDNRLFSDSCSVPRPARASFLNPYNPQEAYFFADTRYALVKADRMASDIINGPKQIVHEWPSLKMSRFGKVDAVLPTGDGYEAYFFARDEYSLINAAPGTNSDWVINGPKKIATEWPALKKAGCKTVDAVLPYPGVPKQAYFFCGTQYVVVKYTPGTTDDSIVHRPKPISAGWSSLAKAGFHRIDSVLPNPANEKEAYFFSRDQYVLVNFTPGGPDKVVRGPRSVYKEWPSLRKAGFYSQKLLNQCKA